MNISPNFPPITMWIECVLHNWNQKKSKSWKICIEYNQWTKYIKLSRQAFLMSDNITFIFFVVFVNLDWSVDTGAVFIAGVNWTAISRDEKWDTVEIRRSIADFPKAGKLSTTTRTLITRMTNVDLKEEQWLFGYLRKLETQSCWLCPKDPSDPSSNHFVSFTLSPCS